MSDQQTQIHRAWEKFLNPEILKSNLVACSLFIATYEILRTSIIDQIKSFFTQGFDGSNWTLSPDYQVKVLSLNKSPFLASQLWLKEMAAINDSDVAAIQQIHDHRNVLAHDLPKVLDNSRNRGQY